MTDAARPDADDEHGYDRFHRLARRLRAECPWDIEQTHRSLVPYLIEETYEVVDAIADLDPANNGSDDALIEELGDLLYQIEFHAAIAEEAGRFSIADVTRGIHDKLVRRHPHVFGAETVSGAAEVLTNWDELKRAEKPERTSVFDGIAASLPSLSLAREVQRKAARAGFDWANADLSRAKVAEELAEVDAAIVDDDRAAIGEEIGDLLFAVVNLARQVDVDPESALRAATKKFESRFRAVEQAAIGDGVELASLPHEALLARWSDAKAAAARSSAKRMSDSPD